MEYSSEEILDLYRPFELQQEALSDLEDHFEKFGMRIGSRLRNIIPLGIATAFFAWMFSAAESEPIYSVYFLGLIFAYPFAVLVLRILHFIFLKIKYRSRYAKFIHEWRQEVGEYVWTVAVLKGPFINRASLRINTGNAGHALSEAASYLGLGPYGPLIAGGVLAVRLASYLADGAYAAATQKKRENELEELTREYCIKALESLGVHADKLDSSNKKDFRQSVQNELTQFALKEVTATANLLEKRGQE